MVRLHHYSVVQWFNLHAVYMRLDTEGAQYAAGRRAAHQYVWYLHATQGEHSYTDADWRLVAESRQALPMVQLNAIAAALQHIQNSVDQMRAGVTRLEATVSTFSPGRFTCLCYSLGFKLSSGVWRGSCLDGSIFSGWHQA